LAEPETDFRTRLDRAAEVWMPLGFIIGQLLAGSQMPEARGQKPASEQTP
jgi:hypothetical protein